MSPRAEHIPNGGSVTRRPARHDMMDRVCIGFGRHPKPEPRRFSDERRNPAVTQHIPNLRIPHQGGAVFSGSLVVTDTGYELLSEYLRDVVYR
jgi:hypothetical protein